MSMSRLPPELLDDLIDLLRDPETLKQCCLVSKSWIPRTRRHLFADIKFRSADDLESWKKTFPNIADSPACHTHTLFVGCPWLIVAADGGEGSWIRAFSAVEKLEVANNVHCFTPVQISLAPFHKFSPTLKSLCIGPIRLPSPWLFDLICSFPLLEDLSLTGRDEPWFSSGDFHRPRSVGPSTSPPFTGSLSFRIRGKGAGNTARQLLELPSGLRFRKLVLLWDHERDLWWNAELVRRCSHTLKSLDITTFCCTFTHICVRANNLTLFPVGPEPGSFNLSGTTNLRDVVFRPTWQTAEWITVALRTITPQHRDLRQISIHLPDHPTPCDAGTWRPPGEEALRKWLDIDRLLAQFWESRSIRPRVGCVRQGEKCQSTEYCIERLLPVVTRRGIVDPIDPL